MKTMENIKVTAKRSPKKRPSQGLGDTIAKVTKATGIEKLVKFALGEDCGCNERKEKLNKLFPYKRQPLCLNENEFFWWQSLKAKTQRIYQKIWRIKSAPFGAEYSNRGSYTAHVLVTRGNGAE
jgi:hypothetical protein